MNLAQHAAPLVGHPLIILLQLIVFPLLIWLFFGVNNRPTPIPQIYLLFPFTVLANVIARTYKLEWLYLTDMVYWGFVILTVIVSGIYAKRDKKAHQALLDRLDELGIDPDELGLANRKKDPFTGWENRSVLLAVGLSFAILAGTYLITYGDKQLEHEEHQTEVQEEHNRLEKKYSSQQQKLLTGITSLSATSQTLVAGLSNLVQGQSSLKRQVQTRTAPLQRISDTTNAIRGDVSDIKRTVEPEPEPTLFEKMKRLKKRLLGKRPDTPDSTLQATSFVVEPDTLVLY